MRWAAKRDANEPSIIRAVELAGWKVFQVSMPDYPDLMCARAGDVVFLEVKRKGKNPTAGQLAQHRRLESAGLRVAVVRSKDEALRAVGVGNGR